MHKKSLLEQAQEQIRPEMLIGGAVTLAVMIALAGTLYVVKPVLAEYRDLLQSRTGESAQLDAESAELDPKVVANLEEQVESYRRQLYGGSAEVSLREMESYVIDLLHRISARHTIELASVKPGEAGSVLMFDELPYDVEVTGSYFKLFDWFSDAERELRPMVVKRFAMRGDKDEGDVALQLRLVAYRPAGTVR